MGPRIGPVLSVDTKTWSRLNRRRHSSPYLPSIVHELSGSIKGGPAYLPVLLKTEAITTGAIMEALPGLLEGMSEFGFTSAIDMGAPSATEDICDS